MREFVAAARRAAADADLGEPGGGGETAERVTGSPGDAPFDWREE
jgi:hypothetical protein